MIEINESELIGKAKKGDKSALSEIVNLYEKRIYNFALRYLHNKEDAEDVLQETFMSVVKAINSFKGICLDPLFPALILHGLSTVINVSPVKQLAAFRLSNLCVRTSP